MSLYDGMMLMVVLAAIITGAWRGAAWQIAPIASLVLGYFFALPLSEATQDWFGEPPLNKLFAMGAMYLVIALGVYMVARSVRESVQRMKLEAFDSHLGAILGGVKGILFTVAITLGLITFMPASRDAILQSRSSTVAARILHRISPVLPEAMTDLLRPYLEQLGPMPAPLFKQPLFPERPVAERRLVERPETERPSRPHGEPRPDTALRDQPVRPRRRPPQSIPTYPNEIPSYPGENAPRRRDSGSSVPDPFEAPVPETANPRPGLPSLPNPQPGRNSLPDRNRPATEPFQDDDLFNADPDKALQDIRNKRTETQRPKGGPSV